MLSPRTTTSKYSNRGIHSILTLNQGHHPELRARMSNFTQSLLNSAIPGLDKTIIIPARRLHLTLGVMSLTEVAQVNPNVPKHVGVPTNVNEPAPRPRTLATAIALLNELRPRITAIIQGRPLTASLRLVDIMRPDNGDLERAHVMWAGPSYQDEEGIRLKRVAGRWLLDNAIELLH